MHLPVRKVLHEYLYLYMFPNGTIDALEQKEKLMLQG